MVTKKRNKAQQDSDETSFTSNIRRTAVSLAVAAALPSAMILPTTAMAQEEGADDEVIEEIVSYGKFRQSLVDSIATKRNSSTIVEAISAEDIGKLPDSSIAETLSRIPGLAGERRNGRTSGISVRGFKEDYTAVTMNGRELLGIGDNRGVEYDLYPSEIISGVVVYKTPDASMTHQGIGGIVDLRTTRPLDTNPHIVINANYESNDLASANPDFDDTGHRLALSYSDIFADDTVGLALAFATTESPSQEQQYNAWNYNTVDNVGNWGGSTIEAGPGVQLTGDEPVLEGHKSFARSGMLERDTFSGVLQFAPNDDVTVTLDALYIDFTENKALRGLEDAWLWGDDVQSGTMTALAAEDGLVTQGMMGTNGFYTVVRNDLDEKAADLTTVGLNVEWDINEDWTMEFDLARGESERRTTNIESYSGTGRSGLPNRPAQFLTWTLTPTGAMFSPHPTESMPDLTDWNIVHLAGPQGWGAGMSSLQDTLCPTPADCTAADGTILNHNNAQDGFVNQPIFDEELTTIRLSAERPLDAGILTGLEVGVYYSDRSKTKDNQGFYLTAPTFPNSEPIPEQYRLGTFDMSWLGYGDVIAYDSLALFQGGYYTASDAQFLQTDRLGDSYTIDEELLSVFAKVDFDTQWGSVVVNGNFGVQIISADQTGNGFYAAQDASGGVAEVPISDGDDYTDVLPSFNINFELADNHMLRAALSKTVTRPRMDDMKPNIRVSFNGNHQNVVNPDPENGPWSGSAGNAKLKPLEANQLDVSYEWYIADDGLISLGWFYKDLTNWHKDGRAIADFTPIYIPGLHQAERPPLPSGIYDTPATFLGVIDFTQDGLEGFVRGFELQGNIPFGRFAEPLEGLGLIASAALYDGALDDGSSIPGLSEKTYQATMYYERGGFQARVSWTQRDDFTTEFPGLSLALTSTIDQGADLIDAQIGYDFGLGGFDSLDGLFISLQGQNLTDESTLQTRADPRMVNKYQTFGANYILNVNYRFK
jgi:iron complex outermembrane receptor protein